MRPIAILALVLAGWSVPALAAPAEGPGTNGAEAVSSPRLTLAEATRTALATHPLMRQAQAEHALAKASADQARAALLPQLSLSSGYQFGPSRQNVNQIDMPLTNIGNYSLGVSADQLLYDFGQAGGRHQALLGQAEAQALTARQTALTVALDVRTAYFRALANQALVNVAEEALANQLSHQRQTRSLVEIGTRPPIDLAQTSKDVANARLRLINAQGDLQAAKAQLNLAMGMDRDTDYVLADEAMPPVAGEDAGLDVLLEEAMSRRPDLQAMSARLQAQQVLIDVAGRTAFPSLKANAGAGLNGTLQTNPNNNWNAGVGVAWPLFAGGEADARVAQEQAKLASLQAQADGLRQQLRLTVERARLAVVAAKAAVQAAEELTRTARRQLDLAEGRYASGLGSVLELGDAQRAFTDARAQAVEETYKLAVARAQLLQALGRD